MDLLWGIGVAAVTGAGLFVAAPAALAAVGFTSAGIAATSIAAGVQSAYIGNVVAGSTFAALQSAGAAGVVSATTGAAISVAAGAVAAATR